VPDPEADEKPEELPGMNGNGAVDDSD
jgi:hypothetical protein